MSRSFGPRSPSPRAQRAPLWPVEGGPVDATELARSVFLHSPRHSLRTPPPPPSGPLATLACTWAHAPVAHPGHGCLVRVGKQNNQMVSQITKKSKKRGKKARFNARDDDDDERMAPGWSTYERSYDGAGRPETGENNKTTAITASILTKGCVPPSYHSIPLPTANAASSPRMRSPFFSCAFLAHSGPRRSLLTMEKGCNTWHNEADVSSGAIVAAATTWPSNAITETRLTTDAIMLYIKHGPAPECQTSVQHR